MTSATDQTKHCLRRCQGYGVRNDSWPEIRVVLRQTRWSLTGSDRLRFSAVHHVAHAALIDADEFVYVCLGHTNGLERLDNFAAYLRKLRRGQVEPVMGLPQRQSEVLDLVAAGHVCNPDGPHDLETRQVGWGLFLVPFSECRVLVQYGIREDRIAEEINDLGDAEDSANSSTKAFGCLGLGLVLDVACAAASATAVLAGAAVPFLSLVA
jgi:hypothetical protein